MILLKFLVSRNEGRGGGGEKQLETKTGRWIYILFKFFDFKNLIIASMQHLPMHLLPIDLYLL